MTSSWGDAWGLAWDDAWGETSTDPNAMRGNAVISLLATGTLSTNSVNGLAFFRLDASGILTSSTTVEDIQLGLGWENKRHKIRHDDELVIQIVLQVAAKVL